MSHPENESTDDVGQSRLIFAAAIAVEILVVWALFLFSRHFA